MNRRFAPVFTLKIACALMLSNLSVGLVAAAPGNCGSLGQLPAALSVGEVRHVLGGRGPALRRQQVLQHRPGSGQADVGHRPGQL